MSVGGGDGRGVGFQVKLARISPFPECFISAGMLTVLYIPTLGIVLTLRRAIGGRCQN